MTSDLPTQLPLVRIKGDTVTLLVWRSLSVGQVVLIAVCLATPFVVYALWGWWIALWSACIPTAIIWAIYRGTFVRIRYASSSVIVDRTEYPRFRIKQFRAIWLNEDSEIDDERGHVQVFLDLEGSDSVLLALMSGAADAPATGALLNQKLAAVRL